MRVLFTAIFLFVANSAMAFGEGRYITTNIGAAGTTWYDLSWILTDTKTGKFRICLLHEGFGETSTVVCHPWFDGINGVEQDHQPLRPEQPFKYIK